jgi:predicted TIM-barrel fold metal-dependent hydrolase
MAVALLLFASTASAADYMGPLIDAHSHVPTAQAIDAYVAAMKRHDIRKVVLLGVGGVQKNDAAWIAAAARKYPDQVVPGVPVPDPMSKGAADALDAALKHTNGRAVGEVHVRQAVRKIERSPSDPAFLKLLAVAARHGTPVIIHAELTAGLTAALEKALAAERKAVIVLAHGPNLMVDLSGMHFQRTPALATESGPLDPKWKALIEKMPDRFLVGIDAWAPRLFEPAMLDRLMKWTRRVLGELPPDVAERVAWKNAAALYRLK